MYIQIVLLKGEKQYQAKIENGETISFGNGKKDTVVVPEFGQEQIGIKWGKKGLVVKAQKFFDCDFDELPLDTVVVLSEEEEVALFATSLVSDPKAIVKFPYNCKITVGRAKENDIVVSLPYVSNTHLIIKNEAGNIRVEDNDSTNGMYLNGKRTSIAKVKSGDVISILSLNLRFLNGELYVENCGNKIYVNNLDKEIYESKVLDDGIHCPHYKRSPRTREKLPTEDIVLSSAPSKAQKRDPHRFFNTSLFSTGAMFAATAAMGVVSPALLAARAASLISPIANMASSGSANKKQNKQAAEYDAARRTKYGAYIEDQKARIAAVSKNQHDIINSENPAPEECINIVNKVKRDLWSRMPGDSDFLSVRLGMGYEDLCVKVKSRSDSDSFRMENDEIEELAAQIIEETRIVDDVPLRVSFCENQTIGIIGERGRVISLVRNLCISLTSLHCFSDVNLVGIFDEKESGEWTQLKWLPHIWNQRRNGRFLAFGEEQTRDLCEVLGNIVKSREESDQKGIVTPHYVVIIGSKELVEKEPVLAKLVENNHKLGMTTLFLFDDMYSLPNSCQYIVDLDNGPCAYLRDEYNKRTYFTEDALVDRNTFNQFARRMSAIELDGFASEEDLPDGISFLEGYKVKRVEELGVLSRWQKSRPHKTLAAPIGALPASKSFMFDIIDSSTNVTAHGPHGLVAGTTGSGKSELLQTWILSMAVNYHPYDVSFVIIDYKGGGMANILSPLPHVVGKITNIDSDISRALDSLKSEVARREKIFSECQVNKIDRYIEMFHEGKVEEPLPHLIIVADEFAELKKEEPEFIPTIIQIARVGRSLGIHLVLATQKPSGVVDEQIWSNSQFQICLKVQSASDSREMIKRPDAAMLTQAGRAYFSTNASFDLLQSYWSGAPYITDSSESNNDCKVSIVDFSGSRLKTVQRKKKNKNGVDEISAVIDYINAEADRAGVEKLRGPWLPELPAEMSINEIGESNSFDGNFWSKELPWLKLPIGLFDMPKNQMQGVQYIDFAAEGHYGIYGASSTGKSTLLKTVIASLCLNYTPKDVSIYVLDCGGWGTSIFSDMPHIGGIAFDGEDEKFDKFCLLINNEINARKQTFMKNAVSSLAKYRENVADDLPAIIIAIDNITPLFELYPSIETLLTTVAAQGPTYGIHIIYTANSTSGVRYKIAQNIKGNIAFELTDKGDYSSIVGRPDGSLPKQPGRALIKGNPPIIFQAAYYADGINEREKNAAIRELSKKMRDNWHGYLPKAIPIMPDEVTKDILKKYLGNANRIPVGIDYESVSCVFADLYPSFSFLITGLPQTGKSKLLDYIANSIKEVDETAILYVFDSAYEPIKSLKAECNYTKWNDTKLVDDMVDEIIEELEKRLEAEDAEGERKIVIVIDDLLPFIKTISDSARDALVKVCRLSEGLNVQLIVSGRVNDIAQFYEHEPLTQAIVSFGNGICLGGCLCDYRFVKTALKYEARNEDMGKGNAYSYKENEAVKIKLISMK